MLLFSGLLSLLACEVCAQDILVGRVPVCIQQPLGAHRGDILVLPGWNFRRTMWCDSTTFCDSARRRGYRLVLPEMGKSVYASHYYHETRADYRQRLTRTWVTDTLLPALQARGIFPPGGNNYLLGLSTGARGVLLVAQATDRLFTAAAGLSGDYDPSYDPTDALMRNTYGPYADFPVRWQGTDSPIHNVRRLHVPLYLAHGQQDRLVPWQHSLRLHQAMATARVKLVLVPTAGHDWTFWGGQTAAILDWFGHHPQSSGNR